MESLAKLLAYAVGGDPDHFDELDARVQLGGFARVLQDEDLVVEIAKRLYEHDRGRVFQEGEYLWDDITTAERNNYILKSLNVLDALRDLITEELAR